MNEFFINEYNKARSTPSDINEHIDTLLSLANQVKHVTEFGVCTGVSTRAFLASPTILRSYDIFHNSNVETLFNISRISGKDAQYIIANTLETEIDETDLLFIDTWHSYEQLKQELQMHAKKVRKYIVFHDTQLFGTQSEPFMGKVGSNGLLPAIIEFIIENHSKWKFKLHHTNNNGLTVIERIS
jgi:hypothetical protein